MTEPRKPWPGSLWKVTDAADRRWDAYRDYHAAILAARAAGHTLAAIAQAAGVTRQAIHEMIRRHEEHKP